MTDDEIEEIVQLADKGGDGVINALAEGTKVDWLTSSSSMKQSQVQHCNKCAMCPQTDHTQTG